MQIWTKDLFDDTVLYNPISKLVAEHLDVRDAVGVDQLVVCGNLALLHATSSCVVTIIIIILKQIFQDKVYDSVIMTKSL